MSAFQTGFALLVAALAVASWGRMRFGNAPAGPFYGPLIAYLLVAGVLLTFVSMAPS